MQRERDGRMRSEEWMEGEVVIFYSARRRREAWTKDAHVPLFFGAREQRGAGSTSGMEHARVDMISRERTARTEAAG